MTRVQRRSKPYHELIRHCSQTMYMIALTPKSEMWRLQYRHVIQCNQYFILFCSVAEPVKSSTYGAILIPTVSGVAAVMIVSAVIVVIIIAVKKRRNLRSNNGNGTLMFFQHVKNV